MHHNISTTRPLYAQHYGALQMTDERFEGPVIIAPFGS